MAAPQAPSSEPTSLLIKTYNQWSDDEASSKAASLAFYTMLSLAPLLIISLAIIGLAFSHADAQTQLFSQIQDLVGQEGADAIQKMVQNASKPASGILASILGFLTLLFAASSVVGELRTSLNHIWKVPVTSGGILGFLKERSVLLALVLGIGFLLLVSLVISTALASMGKFLTGFLPIPELASHVVSFLISFVVITFLFSVLFKVLPETEVSWHDVIPGALFTSFLFTLGKTLIGLYLGKASFGSTYGAAGSLVIVLVWVYYSAQIFFFGAEFTQVYRHRFDPAVNPAPVPEKNKTKPAQETEDEEPDQTLEHKYGAPLSANVAALAGSLIGFSATVYQAFKKNSR